MAVGKGLMLVSLALSAASGAVSTVSAIREGKAAEDRAEHQARVVRSNSVQEKYDAIVNEQTAKVNADSALLSANEKKRRILDQSRIEKHKAIAQLSRQGLKLGSVSFDDALNASLVRSESAATAALYEGSMQATQSRFRGRGAAFAGDRALVLGASKSNELRVAGKNRRQSANIKAFGSALSTGAQMSSIGYDYYG